MAADTGSVISDGFRLQYIVEGAGPPAMVVGSARYYSRAFSQDLRKHLRLAFVDHRGFAAPPGVRDTTAFALDVLLDDMELVRRALDLGPVVVIGHSGHAFMALEYAKKYPASVSHVVMIGICPDFSAASVEASNTYWETSASAERKAVMEENLQRLPDEAIAQLPVTPGRKFISSYIRNAPKIWYDPHFDSSPLWEGVDINMDMFNHVWGRIFRDIEITRGLETLDRPVFLALGRYDFLLPAPPIWDPLRPRFNDLTVRIFERSGHTPQYEEAALFDEELVRWIKR
jgi:proline iminopeptidase